MTASVQLRAFSARDSVKYRSIAAYLLGMATICLGSAAVAQPTDAQADQPATTATPADTGEIVVTAQRRAQRLVDVPIAVTTINADTMDKAGVTSLLDLTKTAPGVLIDQDGPSLQPTIRGIGTNNAGPGADPNVATYVDGVYISSQTGNVFELADVQDIEILKGPQGTLFGRNATGGAILIKLLDPSFTTSGKVDVSYGRFNEVLTSGYVTTGLTDKIAIDLSAYYRHSDGWIHDLRTGDDRNVQHSLDVRSKLLLQATDRLKFILSVAYNDTSDPTGFALAANNGVSIGVAIPGAGPIATQRGTLSVSLAPVLAVKATTVALHGTLDTSLGTVASITSYRHERSNVSGDLDGSYAVLQDAVYASVFKDFTQEVNLTSKPGSPLSYVAGVFYFHESAGDPFVRIDGFPFFHNLITTNAISGYLDGSYKIGQLSIIAGGRYSTEKKDFLYAPGVGPYNPKASSRFSKFTPRAGLSVALSRNSNVYFTYSKGFKSGTYNEASPSTVPVKQEGVDAFEVGYKTQGHSFSLNTSAFYYKYKDIQITAYDYGSGFSRLFNAARAEIYGADADATVHVTPQFDLHAGVAYTHADFTSFPGALVFTPLSNNAGSSASVIDATGNPLIRAPRFTASGTADYNVAVGSNRIDLSLTPYYSTKVYYSFDKRIVQPAYFTLDGKVSYLVGDRIQVSIYGRNLTDKVYSTYRGETSALDSIVFGKPRTFGIAAGYKF